MTEKSWGGMTLAEWRDEMDRAATELGELLKEAFRDLGTVAREAEKLRQDVAEFRSVLADARSRFGEQGRHEEPPP
jgi:hypothetical protein